MKATGPKGSHVRPLDTLGEYYVAYQNIVHCTPISKFYGPNLSVKLVTLGLLPKGRCGQCSTQSGVQRKETRMGFIKCLVRLCPSGCHDLYHSVLQTESEDTTSAHEAEKW